MIRSGFVDREELVNVYRDPETIVRTIGNRGIFTGASIVFFVARVEAVILDLSYVLGVLRMVGANKRRRVISKHMADVAVSFVKTRPCSLASEDVMRMLWDEWFIGVGDGVGELATCGEVVEDILSWSTELLVSDVVARTIREDEVDVSHEIKRGAGCMPAPREDVR
jgi:hypothetical protein